MTSRIFSTRNKELRRDVINTLRIIRRVVSHLQEEFERAEGEVEGDGAAMAGVEGLVKKGSMHADTSVPTRELPAGVRAQPFTSIDRAPCTDSVVSDKVHSSTRTPCE